MTGLSLPSSPQRMAGMIASSLLVAASIAWAEPARLEFNRDIRPILSDNCFQCHGPDEEARKSELRLDGREQGGERGTEGHHCSGSAVEGSKSRARRHRPGPPLLRRVRAIATATDTYRYPPVVTYRSSVARVSRRWGAGGRGRAVGGMDEALERGRRVGLRCTRTVAASKGCVWLKPGSSRST